MGGDIALDENVLLPCIVYDNHVSKHEERYERFFFSFFKWDKIKIRCVIILHVMMSNYSFDCKPILISLRLAIKRKCTTYIWTDIYIFIIKKAGKPEREKKYT